jgi:hypothetical protein
VKNEKIPEWYGPRVTWQPLATSAIRASGYFERGKEYPRSDFLPVGVATSRYFRTSVLWGLCLVVNICTTLKLSMHESH